MNVSIKRHISQVGFFCGDDSFNHSVIGVPGDCEDWNDDVGDSLCECLETVCRQFNAFSEKMWKNIEQCQEMGIEDVEPYQSQLDIIQSMEVSV